jgi:hypothetical protein
MYAPSVCVRQHHSSTTAAITAPYTGTQTQQVICHMILVPDLQKKKKERKKKGKVSAHHRDTHLSHDGDVQVTSQGTWRPLRSARSTPRCAGGWGFRSSEVGAQGNPHFGCVLNMAHQSESGEAVSNDVIYCGGRCRTTYLLQLSRHSAWVDLVGLTEWAEWRGWLLLPLLRRGKVCVRAVASKGRGTSAQWLVRYGGVKATESKTKCTSIERRYIKIFRKFIW